MDSPKNLPPLWDSANSMTKRQIVLWPEVNEFCPCEDVKPEDFKTEELKELVADMFELMHKSFGIGLAAPQVGVNKNIFVVDLSIVNTADSGFSTPKVFINPMIIGSMEESELEEGCLSFPGVYQKVKRAKDVTITAQNVDGDFFTEKGYKLYAHVLQHEYDHLRGVTLYDKMSNLKRDVTRRKLAKYTKRSV
jgi:peptide deformylase